MFPTGWVGLAQEPECLVKNSMAAFINTVGRRSVLAGMGSFDSTEGQHGFEERGKPSAVTVSKDLLGQAMVPNKVLIEEMSNGGSIGCGKVEWYQVGSLGKHINADQQEIMTSFSCRNKGSDKVEADGHERSDREVTHGM